MLFVSRFSVELDELVSVLRVPVPLILDWLVSMLELSLWLEAGVPTLVLVLLVSSAAPMSPVSFRAQRSQSMHWLST